MRLRLSSRRSVNSVVTFQAGTTAPVAQLVLVWSTHSTNRSSGNSSSKPIPFRGDATVTIQRATATARGRLRRTSGGCSASGSRPRWPLHRCARRPYRRSRRTMTREPMRTRQRCAACGPTRGPHLASRTAHADVARSKALLPQPIRTVANLLGTHTDWPTGFTGSTVCVGIASVTAVALHGPSGPST